MLQSTKVNHTVVVHYQILYLMKNLKKINDLVKEVSKINSISDQALKKIKGGLPPYIVPTG